MQNRRSISILNTSSERELSFPIFSRAEFEAAYIYLESYRKRGWIEYSAPNGQAKIAVKTVSQVGFFPLGPLGALVVVPAGMKDCENGLLYCFSGFMMEIFGFTSKQRLFSFGSRRLRNVLDMIVVEDLVAAFKLNLEELPTFPLTNFEAVTRVRRGIRGRILSSRLFQHLFVKPQGKIECAFSELLINSVENRIIRATIELLLTESLCRLDQDCRLFFDRAVRLMIEGGVEKATISDLNGPIPNPKTEYKKIISISKILLCGPGLSSADEFLDLDIPLTTPDHRFFEKLVLSAIQKVEPTATSGSSLVSSFSEHTFNPDIVFSLGTSGESVVADVKFKRLSFGGHGTENRADIYQVLSHSLAFEQASNLAIFYPSSDGSTGKSVRLRLDKLVPSKSVLAVWVDQVELLKFVTERLPSEVTRRTIIQTLRLISSEKSSEVAA